MVPLAQGLALLPMTWALHAELTGDGRVKGEHGFEWLSPGAAAWAARVSRAGPIVYVEAGEFGDVGSQIAVVWERGALAAGPLNDVNPALRRLGAARAPGSDEFDGVGLGRFRRTDAWAATAIVDALAARAGGPVASLVEGLVFEHGSRALKNRVRGAAAARLGGLGVVAREAVPALAERARTDADYGVRLSATCALAEVGQDGVAALRALLVAPEVEDRWPAAFALGRLGTAAAPAVPELARALDDSDYRARAQAAETLAAIGPAAAPAVAALVRALADPEWPVRSHAAQALGRLGPAARPAADALRAATADPDAHVRRHAADALATLLTP